MLLAIILKGILIYFVIKATMISIATGDPGHLVAGSIMLLVYVLYFPIFKKKKS